MRIRTTLTSAVLCTVLAATPALAQQAPRHVAGPDMLREALAARHASEQQTRDALRRLLKHDQVREVAGRLGMTVATAEAAVATLSSEDLARLAGPARQAETELAGGSQTIVISTTTLLLLIIIIILLAD